MAIDHHKPIDDLIQYYIASPVRHEHDLGEALLRLSHGLFHKQVIQPIQINVKELVEEPELSGLGDNIQVNAVDVDTTGDFNDLLPAAPADTENVRWQRSSKTLPTIADFISAHYSLVPRGFDRGSVIGGFLDTVSNPFTSAFTGQQRNSNFFNIRSNLDGYIRNLYTYLSATQTAGALTRLSGYQIDGTNRTDLGIGLVAGQVSGAHGDARTYLRILKGDAFNIRRQNFGVTGPNTQGFAMEFLTDDNSSLFGSAGIGTLTAGQSKFVGIYNSATQNASPSENDSLFPLPFSGKIKNLFVQLTTAHVAGGTFVVTMRKGTTLAGMLNTALAVTIPASAGVGTYVNITDEITVAENDLICFKFTNNGSSSSAPILHFVVEYTNDSGVLGRCISGWHESPVLGDVTRFGTFFTSKAASSSEVFTPCPRDMTISKPKLWVSPPFAPPVFTCVYTVRKNGTDTGVGLSFGGADSDVLIQGGGSVDFLRGDLFSLKIVNTQITGFAEPRGFTVQID